MSANEKTADELFESVNGFDEIAIAAHFGRKITSMREDPFDFLRALVFVDQRREGLKDKEAHQAAMEMTVGQINVYFVQADPLDEESGEGEGSAA